MTSHIPDTTLSTRVSGIKRLRSTELKSELHCALGTLSRTDQSVTAEQALALKLVCSAIDLISRYNSNLSIRILEHHNVSRGRGFRFTDGR